MSKRFKARLSRVSHAIRSLVLAFALVLNVPTSSQAAPNAFLRGTAEEEAAVLAQSQKDIHLLDAGEYGKAWDQAAKPFQALTPRLAFVVGIQSVRALVGQAKTRSVRGIGFTKELQDAPPGHYAGVVFETTFADVSGVEEKMIFFQQNGEWRLAGYFLKKRVSSPRPSAP